MKFKIPFKLPVDGKMIGYAEMTNRHWECMIKSIATNHDMTIEQAFDALILETANVNPSKLAAVDKFCLLLDLRSVMLGDQIEFRAKSEGNVRMYLSKILKIAVDTLQSHKFTHDITYKEFTLTVGLPRNLYINGIDDVVSSSIYHINDGETIYPFDEFTASQQETVLDSLPAEILSRITNIITNHKHITQGIMLIKPNDKLGIDAIPFELYNNTMFELLKAVFASDLMNYYEMQYNLLTKLNISYEHFMQMTPNESRIFVNLHNKEIKKQEDQKSSSPTPTRFQSP